MREIWVQYPDIARNELTAVVKVVRRGGLHARVLPSNGRSDLVPSQHEPPIAVGDKVILRPPPTGFYTPALKPSWSR